MPQLNSKTVYKIRNKNTGLYSKGGSYVNESKYGWSQTGKTWSSRSALMGHLAQYVKLPYRYQRNDPDKVPTVNIPEYWEVIAIEVKTIEDIGVHIAAKDFYISHSEHFKK